MRKGGESGHLVVSDGDPLPLNSWSHITFTDDGARLRFYVNGEIRDEQPAIPLTAAKGPLTIGCLANYGNFFRGKIDEVRVYNRALGPARSKPTRAPRSKPHRRPRRHLVIRRRRRRDRRGSDRQRPHGDDRRRAVEHQRPLRGRHGVRRRSKGGCGRSVGGSSIWMTSPAPVTGRLWSWPRSSGPMALEIAALSGNSNSPMQVWSGVAAPGRAASSSGGAPAFVSIILAVGAVSAGLLFFGRRRANHHRE
jgi:Concanavalin A-like lectin/glucanases superfamily